MQQYFSEQKEKDLLIIKENDYHHIKNVMRLKEDDEVVLVYNENKYLCKLKFIDNFIYGEIINEIKDDLNKYPEIILIYGMPKNEKFELVLQKSCELGVSKIVPFLCERTLIRLEDNKISKKMERWNKILKEASEQSRRNDIPLITNPIYIDELKNHLGDIKIVCDERKYIEGVSSFNNELKELKNVKSISLIVGPEGGFSDKEFNYFDSLNIKPVSLGKRILRSETACIYALSIVEFFKELD